MQSHNSDRQVKALRGPKKESQIINLNLLPPPPKSPKSKQKKNKRKKSGRRSKVGRERLRESMNLYMGQLHRDPVLTIVQLMAITILICLSERKLYCLIKVLSSPFDFMRMPQTSFDCRLRAPGYYADMEANCKVRNRGRAKTIWRESQILLHQFESFG